MSDSVDIRSVDRDKRGRAMAEALSDFVNNYNAPKEDFVKYFLRQHRTLQQSMMRLFFQTIQAMSEVENFDGRNEASVKQCRDIVKLFEEEKGYGITGLPLV